MEVITLFSIVGIVIFIGFISEYIFEKTNIPDIIWLMLLGMILSRFININESAAFKEIAPIFTTFALIFILFEGVLSVDLKQLFTGVVKGSSISFLNLAFSMLLVSFVMMILGWGFWEGLLLGAILADSAQTVIIPLLKKIHITPETSIILTFESAISDILSIVGALAIVNIIMFQSFSVTMVLQEIMYSFFFAVIVGIVAAVLWIKLLPHMNKFSKSYMTTIAALVLVYAFVEKLEANGPLACLAFGIVVGNSQKIYTALKKKIDYDMEEPAKFFYSQISFFLKTFFFVYLGLIINLKEPKLLLIGFLLTLILFLVRPLSVFISQRKVKMNDKNRTFLEVMNPKGLSAAVLAQLPLQYGISHGAEFSTIVMSAIITSVMLCLAGVYFTEKNQFKGVWGFLHQKNIKEEANLTKQ